MQTKGPVPLNEVPGLSVSYNHVARDYAPGRTMTGLGRFLLQAHMT